MAAGGTDSETAPVFAKNGEPQRLKSMTALEKAQRYDLSALGAADIRKTAGGYYFPSCGEYICYRHVTPSLW